MPAGSSWGEAREQEVLVAQGRLLAPKARFALRATDGSAADETAEAPAARVGASVYVVHNDLNPRGLAGDKCASKFARRLALPGERRRDRSIWKRQPSLMIGHHGNDVAEYSVQLIEATGFV